MKIAIILTFLDPPASELRRLVVENGGEWHTYFIPGQTTYKIATSLAISKWKSMTKHEVFLKPDWITDSYVFPQQIYAILTILLA